MAPGVRPTGPRRMGLLAHDLGLVDLAEHIDGPALRSKTGCQRLLERHAGIRAIQIVNLHRRHVGRVVDVVSVAVLDLGRARTLPRSEMNLWSAWATSWAGR